MPFGYLFGVVLVTWCTSMALRPLGRRGRRGRMSWRFALVINELPVLAGLLLLASTALAFGQGDIDSVGAWLTFGLALLTLMGLAVLLRRGLLAGQVVERALAHALEGWPAEPEHAEGFDHGSRPWFRLLFAPFLVRRADVERVADVSYGEAGQRNRLDIYRHRSHPVGGPIMVYLHGGGFFSGRKDKEARPLLYRLASQGWTCISANYRLRPEAGFPEHLIDAKRVIAWARAHAADHGADPSLVFIAGSSAGGHLAVMCGLTPDEPAFQPGFEGADTSVSAVVSLYGYYGTYYGRSESDPLPSSPLAYDACCAPPFFVAHGALDSYLPVEGARQFVSTLRRTATEPVVYAELPGGQHTFDLFRSPRFEGVVDGVEAFASWVRSRHGAGA